MYVSSIKIVLYFISILHVILKKSVLNFCFLKLFCSLVKNENTKRAGFYTFNKGFLKFSSAKTTTVFTRVTARGAHSILSSQRGVLIRGRRSFEGGAH